MNLLNKSGIYITFFFIYLDSEMTHKMSIKSSFIMYKKIFGKVSFTYIFFIF